MSDLEEGIFGWVTVNFLLDKLGEPGQEFILRWCPLSNVYVYGNYLAFYAGLSAGLL